VSARTEDALEATGAQLAAHLQDHPDLRLADVAFTLSAPAGNVDYVAANAFLNAFADSRRDVRVIAINWIAWRDVGMAARTSSTHPLLGRRLVDTGTEIVYRTSLRRERLWVLAEHCLKTGQPVFPGAG
jgi:acyl transferase domain-containing protein